MYTDFGSMQRLLTWVLYTDFDSLQRLLTWVLKYTDFGSLQRLLTWVMYTDFGSLQRLLTWVMYANFGSLQRLLTWILYTDFGSLQRLLTWVMYTDFGSLQRLLCPQLRRSWWSILVSGCACVSVCVHPFVKNRAARVLKFHIWIPHGKIADTRFFLFQGISVSGDMPLWKNQNEIWCMPCLMNRAC